MLPTLAGSSTIGSRVSQAIYHPLCTLHALISPPCIPLLPYPPAPLPGPAGSAGSADQGFALATLAASPAGQPKTTSTCKSHGQADIPAEQQQQRTRTTSTCTPQAASTLHPGSPTGPSTAGHTSLPTGIPGTPGQQERPLVPPATSPITSPPMATLALPSGCTAAGSGSAVAVGSQGVAGPGIPASGSAQTTHAECAGLQEPQERPTVTKLRQALTRRLGSSVASQFTRRQAAPGCP